ncbi:divergent protein kinase domain 1C [Anastrepha obliqua]|uniref:divergent protein kinase domain 1C n=1 Tax=Anastrepha obliqua TaxID=95512 RepID=UPI0024093E58|nr:divergent protein kinase domain 1C [Anastrepha obliqua]
MLFTSIRRRLRRMQFPCYMVLIVLLVLAGVVFTSHYFCSSALREKRTKKICMMYKNGMYNGSLCEELCKKSSPFVNIKCSAISPFRFTAQKNGNIIEFRRAKEMDNDLAWRSKSGKLNYPKLEDFHHIIKMHLLVNYNVTLEENTLSFLIKEEIDRNNKDQMLNFYQLFKDHNYLMSKLFEDEELFPTILGTCGPYYAVEDLKTTEMRNFFTRYFLGDAPQQMLFKRLLDYIARLDMVRPDPLKICKVNLHQFGLTSNLRFKALNADYIQLESQVNRRLASGKSCWRDSDCDWHQCRGSCDKQKQICNGAQTNDNLEVLCDFVRANLQHFTELKMRPTTHVLRLYEDRCLHPMSKDRNKW